MAYNRVGLTEFFLSRNIEDLYLNPTEWYSSHPDILHHQISTRVSEVRSFTKEIVTDVGQIISYDLLVLATGSDAVVPKSTPGHNATGVFVYRNIDDLQKLITYSVEVRGSTGAVVGGGLLGLEAAKAMMDLEQFREVKLIDKNPWVLSRQLDQDAGNLVIEKITELGLDVMRCHRIKVINTTPDNRVKSVTFENGSTMDCTAICFAVSTNCQVDGEAVANPSDRSVSNHATSLLRAVV